MSPSSGYLSRRGLRALFARIMHSETMSTAALPNTGLERTRDIRESVTFDTKDKTKPPICAAAIFTKTDDELIYLFGKCFEPELQILQRALPTAEAVREVPLGCYGSPKDENGKGKTPSCLLYGRDFSEVNRTIVGALALKWLVTGDYETFTRSQHPSVKLSKPSFETIRQQVLRDVTTQEELYALIVSMIINDLGKEDPHFDDKAEERKHGKEVKKRKIDRANHDQLIYQCALNGKLALLNEFRDLDDNDKSKHLYKWLLLGLQVGANLNVPQFAQAENVPGSLSASKHMKNNDRAFELKLLEIILDVAGARGHDDSQGALAMLEPTWQSFSMARGILFKIANTDISVREAYDETLEARASLLEKTGSRKLDVHKSEERALLRLLTMGRALEKNDRSNLIQSAFNHSLTEEERQKLVNGLSVDGTDDGTAIVPYYGPSLFANVFEKTQALNDEKKISALAALMRFLVRVYRDTAPNPKLGKGKIVECKIDFAKEVISQEQFREDPAVLDQLEVEEDAYDADFKDWIR